MNANGQEITNIFAYDCEGNPLDAVRLYDQDGNPVETRPDGGPWDPSDPTPPERWDDELQEMLMLGLNPLATGADAWNVFPLTEARHDDRTGEYDNFQPAQPRKSELPPLARDCNATDDVEGGSADGAETAADTDDPSASADAVKSESEPETKTELAG